MNDDGGRTWLFRTGIAIKPDLGYLLACDPSTEENAPHAKIIVVQGDKLFESWVKFNAHSICRITSPENAIVVLCGDGFYALFAKQVHAGNVFKETRPDRQVDRFGSFRRLASIDGKAYAVGTRGMVYRFDGISAWTPIDSTLPSHFDAQAIDGFAENDFYAVGFRGELMHYDGRAWATQTLPTNANLCAVLCAPDRYVYIAGHRGTLLCGYADSWRTIGDAAEDIWSLAWFAGAVYASSFQRVARVDGDQLTTVSFAPERPKSFYHLSAGDRILWSIGEKDVISFDGKQWKRVL